MTRYLLDTTVISNVTEPDPSVVLTAWMGDQADEDMFITSLTIANAQCRWRAPTP